MAEARVACAAVLWARSFCRRRSLPPGAGVSVHADAARVVRFLARGHALRSQYAVAVEVAH
eukprot:13495700-Alexandrium_andersonii.AAC.1